MASDPQPLTWFIGDGVLTRYSETEQVRITPDGVAGPRRRFRIAHMTRTLQREVLQEEFRVELMDALELGEDWVG